MSCPGFYVAHHRWLDSEYGPDALYKVGHTGDLRTRINDGAYTTCFAPSWKYMLTFETATKRDAHRLETGVLDCVASRRVRRENGVLSELVRLSLDEIGALAVEVAGALQIDGALRLTPLAVGQHDNTVSAQHNNTTQHSEAKTAILSEHERSILGEIRQRLVNDLQPTLDDLVDDLVDSFDASTITPPVERIASLPDATKPPPKTAADYVREGRERLALSGFVAATDSIASESFASESFADESDAADAVADAFADLDGFDAYQLNPDPLENRAYQYEAIWACLNELSRKEKAILQMACRCGKTCVAHGVIQDYLVRPRKSMRPRVLYLVPGLVLLRQTTQKLDRYGFSQIPEILLVGSDDRPLTDLRVLRPCGDQDIPAGVTDPDLIQRVCNRENGPPLLVISTYQSSPLLPDVFDLIVFDESHRTCGDRHIRPFTHILLNHQNSHRLYMTATPRYDAPLSMKDRNLFGGVAYAYHMRQGIDAGYVNDFSVELVGRESDRSTESNLATAPQIVAAINTLNNDCNDAGKLLVFCRSIQHAIQLQTEVVSIISNNGTNAIGSASSVSKANKITCLTAHSRMAQPEIAENLARFCAPGTSAILFNCRLFQEGVEIPSLNGIFFAAPRHSPRDIIQSLCRPLNVVPGKPSSKVFIPVSIDINAAPDSVSNLEHFASIIPYFDALVAEDPLLYEHLLDPRGTSYPLRWVNSAVGTLRYEPDKILSAARRSVRRGGNGKTERLLRAARIPWEIGFAELQRIVRECGRYPKTTDAFQYSPDAKVNFGQFYRYARDSYAKWRAGEPQPLEPHQLYALENLPGWDPYGIEGPYPWRETMDFLEQWLREHEGVPPMVEINKGGFVGLSSSIVERLSGTLTCVNQSDGRDRKNSAGGPRPGSGFTLDLKKQRDLDELCARWGLRWRKERYPPPEGSPEGSVGGLIENEKGEYVGAKTFIQEAYTRFKEEWGKNGAQSEYIQRWFKGYPRKHQVQEDLTVWAHRKEIVPPRWRGRGKAPKTEWDAGKTVYQ